MMKYPNVTAGQTEAMINILGGWEKFQQVLSGAVTVVIKTSELLRQFATATVRATKKFAANDHFVVDTTETAKVKIGYLGDDFRANFLAKTEKNILVTDLVAHDLVKDSLDRPILDQLGDKAETTLAHLWELLTKQPKGEAGILLTNGYANIFYIKDAKGKLWAVCASWYAHYGDWRVSAYSVERPSSWYAGSRVFSRK